ncbi:MAG: hypothetical protein WAK85_12110, partial [Xanthobacteraceae bacterium]
YATSDFILFAHDIHEQCSDGLERRPRAFIHRFSTAAASNGGKRPAGTVSTASPTGFGANSRRCWLWVKSAADAASRHIHSLPTEAPASRSSLTLKDSHRLVTSSIVGTGWPARPIVTF